MLLFSTELSLQAYLIKWSPSKGPKPGIIKSRSPRSENFWFSTPPFTRETSVKTARPIGRTIQGPIGRTIQGPEWMDPVPERYQFKVRFCTSTCGRDGKVELHQPKMGRNQPVSNGVTTSASQHFASERLVLLLDRTAQGSCTNYITHTVTAQWSSLLELMIVWPSCQLRSLSLN